MGLSSDMPEYQLNVASTGATSSQLPEQANELVNRLNSLKWQQMDGWTLIIITIGTEEICESCTQPNVDAIDEALTILSDNLQRTLVVLLGPIHVSSAHNHEANLLK